MQYRYPNFDLLRLLLALEVVVAHVWNEVDRNFSWNPWVVAVPAFLGISGFLVLKSFSESGSWIKFAKKRLLRIFPALIASFILTIFLMGPTFTVNSIVTWLTGGIVALPGGSNLPLWSLLWEEIAYAALAILWLCGAYKRPLWIWVLLLISLGNVIYCAQFSAYVQTLSFLPASFFCGNLMYLYRRRLMQVNAWVPWFFLICVLLSRPLIREYSLIPPAVFQTLAIVWVGIAGAKLVPFRFPDLSYGAYIYHFPIMAFVVYRLENTSPLGAPAMIAAMLIPFCLFSWYAIEKPALALKPKSAGVALA